MAVAYYFTISFLCIFWSAAPVAAAPCQFPETYGGNWYHREKGKDTVILISAQAGTWGGAECYDIFLHPSQVKDVTGRNSTILLKQTGANCWMCTDVIYRSDFILQYKMDGCTTEPNMQACPGLRNLPEVSELTTMFNEREPSLNCIASMEGWYQFSYQINTGGGGICNHSMNILDACQVPSSPVYDNRAITMSFKRCPDQQNSYNRISRFKCMGRWDAYVGGSLFTYIALVDDTIENKQDKYKCLITERNQQMPDNSIRWGMSRFGDCKQLRSLDNSPMKIVLRRVAPRTEYMIPQCTMPRNMTGTWFTQGIQFASNVRINDTHIYYRTKKSQFVYEETWFSCQAQLGTRYLMTKVVVGRCEINFVCFDMAPRHHGIVRYRVGRPVKIPLSQDEYTRDTNFLARTFREVCSWQWLSLERDNVDWKYEILIQDPPSPVVCPIGGRYYFKQYSDDPYQLYDTRIRGVTDRPRNTIYCLQNVSEVKSCVSDQSRIEIDTWYCETVDYRGRPIGEYEEPDHILTCAGYWMEDMKSYLITYDEEDAISMFRCWVYERISWTEIAISRAETARCPRQQTSRSNDIDGARFYMELTEKERLFDDCPTRYDPGLNPNMKPRTMFTLYDGKGVCHGPSWLGILVSLLIARLLWK